MTLNELIQEINARKAGRAAYVADTDTARYTAAVLRHLQEYTRKTLCLRTKNATLAVQAGVSTYSVTDCSLPMLKVEAIYVDNIPLVDVVGTVGATPDFEIVQNERGVKQLAPGKIRKFSFIDTQTFLFTPAPDADKTLIIEGAYQHPDVAGGDQILVSTSDEEGVIDYILFSLLRYSKDPDTIAFVNGLIGLIPSILQDSANRVTDQRTTQLTQRGRGRRQYNIKRVW